MAKVEMLEGQLN
jgi:hypothetical protein